MLRTDGRVRVLLVAVMATSVLVLSGCGQTVAGTPHAEGEGPNPAAAGSDTPAVTPAPTAAASPPTDFQEPSGRPTVTVQPDETLADGARPGVAPPSGPPSEPLVPGPLPGLATPTAAPTADPRPTSTRSPAAVPAPGQDAAGRDSGGRASGGRDTGERDIGGGRPSVGGGGDAAAAGARPPGSASAALGPLTADVMSDECLLDAAGFAALLGSPVGQPTENAVTRPDGSRTRSCYATARSGSATGAINVYRVNRGTPAAFVREAAGGRAIDGVGEAAVLLDTVGGSTLQIATARYLVTINVVDTAPTGARWAAAGRAAADAAGRR